MEKLAKNNQYNHYCEKCKAWKLHARGPKFYRCLACNTKVARANNSVHADAGESAASSELVQASALSTSQAEPTPTQRG